MGELNKNQSIGFHFIDSKEVLNNFNWMSLDLYNHSEPLIYFNGCFGS